MTAYEAKWDEIKNRGHFQRLSSNAFFKFVMYFFLPFLFVLIHKSCHIMSHILYIIPLHIDTSLCHIIYYISYMYVYLVKLIFYYISVFYHSFVDIVIMSHHIIYHLLHIISWKVSFNGHLPESKLQEFHTFTESFTDIRPDLDKYIWSFHCGRDHRGCEIRTILLKITG